MPEPDAAHPDSGSDRPAAGALGLRPDWWLVIASSLEYLAISISTQASNQLWLDRFGGDYAAQARVMGRLSSGAAVLGLFLRPLVAQSSDIFGRKPLLLLAYGLQTLLKGGIAAAPEQLRLPLLALSQYLLGFVTWESSMFTISAAIGDMLSEADPTRLGVMLARQQTMWQVVTIVGPLCGGWLAAASGGPRLPLAVTTAVFGVTTAVVALCVPETLAPEKRSSKFTLQQSSPLSSLQLFRRGPGLACAVLLQTIDFWSDENVLWDVQTVHQVQVTGWDTSRRGVFESATSLINLPSYTIASTVMEKIGNVRAIQLGTAANIVFYAIFGRASRGWHLYAAWVWYTISICGRCALPPNPVHRLLSGLRVRCWQLCDLGAVRDDDDRGEQGGPRPRGAAGWAQQPRRHLPW